MRQSAKIALLLALLGAVACAQGATAPKGELPAYDDDVGDGDNEDTGDGDTEEPGDGDTEEPGDGDGDTSTAGGDGDGDGDSSGAPDAGTAPPAGGPLSGLGDFFNMILGALGGGGNPSSGSDAGTP